MNLAVNSAPEKDAATDYDVVIVARLRRALRVYQAPRRGQSLPLYEAAPASGGWCWYWNRYPGRRVRRRKPGIFLHLLRRLGWNGNGPSNIPRSPSSRLMPIMSPDRFDLKRDIQFETRVPLRTGTSDPSLGDRHRPRRPMSARYVVMATGCLSIPKDIDLPGIENFKGESTAPASGPRTASTSPARPSARSAPAHPASSRFR